MIRRRQRPETDPDPDPDPDPDTGPHRPEPDASNLQLLATVAGRTRLHRRLAARHRWHELGGLLPAPPPTLRAAPTGSSSPVSFTPDAPVGLRSWLRPWSETRQ